MKTPARPHSLRARLVATVLVLLAVTLSIIGVATTLALRQFLYGRLDREVAEANGRFVAAQTGQLVPPGGFRYGIPPQDFLGPVQGPRTVGATIRGGVVQRPRSAAAGRVIGPAAVDDAARHGAGRWGPHHRLPVHRRLPHGGDRDRRHGLRHRPARGWRPDVLARLVVVEVIAIATPLGGGRRRRAGAPRAAPWNGWPTRRPRSARRPDRGEVELAERSGTSTRAPRSARSRAR